MLSFSLDFWHLRYISDLRFLCFDSKPPLLDLLRVQAGNILYYLLYHVVALLYFLSYRILLQAWWLPLLLLQLKFLQLEGQLTLVSLEHQLLLRAYRCLPLRQEKVRLANLAWFEWLEYDFLTFRLVLLLWITTQILSKLFSFEFEISNRPFKVIVWIHPIFDADFLLFRHLVKAWMGLWDQLAYLVFEF